MLLSSNAIMMFLLIFLFLWLGFELYHGKSLSQRVKGCATHMMRRSSKVAEAQLIIVSSFLEGALITQSIFPATMQTGAQN